MNCYLSLLKSFHKPEHKLEHKIRDVEQTLPIRNTSEKLSSMLNNCILRDIIKLLDPYKQNKNKQNDRSDSIITTLTHLIPCHDRTQKLQKTLDLNSQRITQSSQAIRSALDSMNILFNSTDLHKIYTQVIQISSILPPMEH